jgi:DNA polymerase III delta prime subunit
MLLTIRVSMQKILKHYLKRLTNLSSGNKSLLLLGLPLGQFLDIHELDFLNGKASFHLIEQLIAGKSSIYLCDVHDSRFDKVNEASNKLKKLDRTEQFIEDERGAHDLYVGYPMIRGKLSDGTLIRCPLLFFPVSLHMQQNRWLLQQRNEEEVMLNKSFLLAYAYFNQLSLADEWIETSFEDFGTDSRMFRTQLYELLKNSPLEINFNQDVITTDKLQTFARFTKGEFEEQERTGELKLYPEAVLGIFPQAGSYLVPDYELLLQNNEAQSLEELFLDKQAIPPDTSQATREEQTFTPFAIDASQENAIKTVKSGKSLVIQGPPGTGKSQLICNLIADYMARGKKILLVCQKRVALDVVYSRLKEGGMQDFIALVHDFKHDRKALYSQIVSQIEKLDAYKEQNHSLDAIFLERTFLQECRKIDKLSTGLEEFRKALFDQSICGLSVKELYLSSDPLLPHIPLLHTCKHFPFHSLDTFLQKLRYYEAYAAHLEKPAYPWKNRVSFSQFSYTDLEEIKKTIQAVPAFGQEAASRMQAITGEPLPLADIEKYTAEIPLLQQFVQVAQNQAQWEIFQRLQKCHHPKSANLAWMEEAENKLLSYLQGTGIEKSLSTDELATFHTNLAEAREARAGFFSWYLWLWFSKNKAQVASVATTNGLSLSQEDIEVLSRKVANRLAMEDLLVNIREVGPIENPYEPDAIRTWFYQQKKAIELASLLPQLSFLQNYPHLLDLSFSRFARKTEALNFLLQDIQLARTSWKRYLTEPQIELILTNNSYADELTSSVQEDFDALVELDRIKESMDSTELEVTHQLWEHKMNLPADTPSMNMISLFENSLRIAWIEQIEATYPILRSVATLKLEQMELELQESILKKMQIGRNITLLKAREQTYRELEYNRLGNLVTYRDLKHQAGKKRNIWQIRKLFTAFADEIVKLIPCWMASPESVSAIFQMKELFDLVIFDEASQCFAERGIPAIFRARQVVVTGDDKQLPPSDLYRVRFEEETEDTPELEVDSLLDLAAHYFPQVQLQGHYRSKSLELIDFSNKHFYKNTLQLLPDRRQINKQEPAVKYLKVAGIWQDNTNRIEADEVVTLVSQLTSQWPDKEIGVVTFNFRQQTLIQDLLEEQALQTGKSFPTSLFVKNIENVQGDERDIVIFSVGYAPDARGRMAMQFGSLNMQGGENRLNVAVTRAREQIYIISSILPPQLRTDDTLHPGPKLLKEYLAYALRVSGGEYLPSPRPVKEFEVSRLLKDKLITWNQNLARELPFADLTFKKEEKYQSLLLTDDDLYHQSLSAKDAHAYTPFLLAKKNWPFIRIYSREYWKDKTKVQEKLSKCENAEI